MLTRETDEDNTNGHDPGRLRDQIDPAVWEILRVDHVALDGGPHVTPEDLERLAADLLPIAAWTGGRA